MENKLKNANKRLLNSQTKPPTREYAQKYVSRILIWLKMMNVIVWMARNIIGRARRGAVAC